MVGGIKQSANTRASADKNKLIGPAVTSPDAAAPSESNNDKALITSSGSQPSSGGQTDVKNARSLRRQSNSDVARVAGETTESYAEIK